jgi:hypothetical protein
LCLKIWGGTLLIYRLGEILAQLIAGLITTCGELHVSMLAAGLIFSGLIQEIDMDRRDVSKALLGVAAGSAVLPRAAEAQTCTAPCYPTTAAESAAKYSPNTLYPSGNLLRYGADPTGVTASDTALSSAIQFATTIPPTGQRPSAPSTIYAPAGLYTFTTGVSTGTSSFTLTGDGRGNSNSKTAPTGPGGGTIFQLVTPQTSGYADAAILTFTAFVEWIRVEKIQFVLGGSLGQYCLYFTQGVRDTLIDDCWFHGNSYNASNPSTSTGCIGIAAFGTTTSYNGDVDIRHCQFSNVTTAIGLAGPNTTVRITTSEFEGLGTSVSDTYGIDCGPLCSGVLIQGCTFENWNIGIDCQGAFLKQMGNWFQSNASDWLWSNGGQSGNSINNCCIGDVNTSGLNNCSYPSGQNCLVVSTTYVQHA